LLQHGADINTTDSKGSTLLHSACNSYREDQVGMVTKLLERGANANARNQDGQTPLFCAASHSSYVNIAKLLLERGGCDVDATDNHGNTPLLESHQPPMMALLLEKGANVNARNDNGATKLHDIGYMMESSPGASFANVTLLVQAGIDLNAKNNKGETALATAIHNNKQDLVNRLLQEGADPNAIDNNGWTALHVASHCGGRTHLMGPLFEAGVNVNATSDTGMTALHVAVRSASDYHFENVKELLEHRADANAITQNGSTPLGVAILGRWGSTKVVKMLLEHGANVNAVMTSRKEKAEDSDSEDSDDGQDSEDYDEHDDGKETPLHAAIARKHQDIALLLLNSGADTGANNARGETPLLQASKFGLVRGVARLLAMGVNVNVSSGETSMDVASQGGHVDVVHLLLPHYVLTRS
jgi:ankyrin repeat protein